MSQDKILLLQCVAGSLQFFNVGAASMNVHIPSIVQLLIGSVLFGFQIYLQAKGNKSIPEETQAMIDAALKSQQEKK